MIKLEHRFVEFIPKELENDVIYISIRFKTIVHKCVCGCGNKTVTPLSPTDWRLIFNGKYISIEPSIGNWSFPCESHYWIINNHVEWASKWTNSEIRAGRNYNRLKKDNYYSKTEENKSKNYKIARDPWWKFKWLFD